MIAQGCASVGVLLLISAGLSPEAWYPVAQFFTGLAFIAVAHVLAPCDTWISVRRKD
jgi:hypothetical protein